MTKFNVSRAAAALAAFATTFVLLGSVVSIADADKAALAAARTAPTLVAATSNASVR